MPVHIDEIVTEVVVQPTTQAEGQALPRELVLQIVDMVYAMLQEDLRIAQERRRESGMKGDRHDR